MEGETNLKTLIKNMTPKLNEGEFVFATVKDASIINREDVICEFKEHEGTTLVIAKNIADSLQIDYNFVASWITLKIHSSLYAVGLTATFSTELAKHNISCNVIAAYHHDHIFVAKKDANKAIEVLMALSDNYK